MDPTAFSLGLGILVFVLSYSFFRTGWTFSLVAAIGAMVATGIVHQVIQRRGCSVRHDFKQQPAVQANRT
jgi:uncharacterized membrane protein